jgi:DUF1680 family protein
MSAIARPASGRACTQEDAVTPRSTLSLLLGLAILAGCRAAPVQEAPAAVQPALAPLSAAQTRITGGILGDRTRKNIDNLYRKIDVETLAQVFREEHEDWYAEPEFVGHYLEAGTHIHDTTGDPAILEGMERVIESILENQPPSGYLGTYEEGLEFGPTFSVWNQNFVIKGLLAWYEHTGDERALEAAKRCADFIAEGYLRGDVPDLLFGLNSGIQHPTIIDEMAHLYRLTGEPRYLEFADYIMDRLEASSIKLVSLPVLAPAPWYVNFAMGCKKGIEMFVAYRGVLDLYGTTGRANYLQAAKVYWEGLAGSHIRVTGNGTLNELWTYHGNRPMALTNELKPNENCVAMGWMQMCAKLAAHDPNGRYFDQFEKTLYNHMIGSQALDGRDFSYYQGNVGHKVHENQPGFYSCCRYRGMRILAHLPRFVYMKGTDSVTVNLFTPSTTELELGGAPVTIEQATEYPRDGRVLLTVRPDQDATFGLRVRQPGWCEKATVMVNGSTVEAEAVDGYLNLEREWASDGDAVEVVFDMPTGTTEVTTVDGEPSVAVSYGPLVLALDSRYGTPIEATVLDGDSSFELLPVETGTWIPQVKLQARGAINGRRQPITLVDYASAGSLAPGEDEFRLWIPVAPR